ncbi:hypothetical protein IW261DRAFT_1424399 [Armillaria novae-zelandiae]|uniref:Uncharacterized protein n=1 Tax=Armillaria novae-zelandiae TaxID=153914 RepID=A0AA39NVS8_9AGAR|nr:hypothetical protein IW261DRAFT_1424399 [Armillaria novae-zelandiae]
MDSMDEASLVIIEGGYGRGIWLLVKSEPRSPLCRHFACKSKHTTAGLPRALRVWALAKMVMKVVAEDNVTLCDTMAPSCTFNLKSFTKSSLSAKSPEMPYEKKFLVVQRLLGKTMARNIAKHLKSVGTETFELNIFSLATADEMLIIRFSCLEEAWNTAGPKKCPFCRGNGMFAVHISWVAVDLVDRALRKEASHRKKRKIAKKLAQDTEKQLKKLNSIKSRYSGANDGRPSEAPEVIEID